MKVLSRCNGIRLLRVPRAGGDPIQQLAVVAVRERIGDRFKRLGSLLCRYHVMRQIENLYDLMRGGAETFPLVR